MSHDLLLSKAFLFACLLEINIKIIFPFNKALQNIKLNFNSEMKNMLIEDV